MTHKTVDQSAADNTAHIIVARMEQLGILYHVPGPYNTALTFVYLLGRENATPAQMVVWTIDAFLKSPSHYNIVMSPEATTVNLAAWKEQAYWGQQLSSPSVQMNTHYLLGIRHLSKR